MQTVTLARLAMATRFEVVLHGDDPVALRAAGDEALAEVERLEGRLSLYRQDSEIAHLNSRAALEPVRVSPDVFRLLQLAGRLASETDGAFDVTIAPLVRCWGFMGDTGSRPDPAALAAARATTGMRHFHLNAEDRSVAFDREGVMLDLGAIGKGWAVEQAADILREAGVTSALIHGGTSTVYAIGHPPDAESWNVAIEQPLQPPSSPAKPAAVIPLRDESLSVSAVWGKSFTAEGTTFGHVLDPRSGRPADLAVLAAVAGSSATETDALSTALLVLGEAGHDRIAALRPGLRTLVLAGSANDLRATARGIAWEKAQPPGG
jgi:thiamine biosynthesis lipoprotein